MFNNLIESSLHTRELKRRGSFVLFTMTVYALLFVTAGVASIYAYDAHLKSEDNEMVLLGYVPIEQPKAATVVPHRTTSASAPRNSAPLTRAVDPIHVVERMNPNNVPPVVGNTASALPEARPGAYKGTDDSRTAENPGGGGSGIGSGSSDRVGAQIVLDTAAPPPPTPTPKPQTVFRPVLNGYAIELPKPPYSEMAKQVHAQGTVQVQVLINESGKVISAHAVSGHPLLVPDAVRAAYRARFSPTKIGDEAVKVSGVINYNFILQ